jgi:hypothetical protein
MPEREALAPCRCCSKLLMQHEAGYAEVMAKLCASQHDIPICLLCIHTMSHYLTPVHSQQYCRCMRSLSNSSELLPANIGASDGVQSSLRVHVRGLSSLRLDLATRQPLCTCEEDSRLRDQRCVFLLYGTYYPSRPLCIMPMMQDRQDAQDMSPLRLITHT